MIILFLYFISNFTFLLERKLSGSLFWKYFFWYSQTFLIAKAVLLEVKVCLYMFSSMVLSANRQDRYLQLDKKILTMTFILQIVNESIYFPTNTPRGFHVETTWNPRGVFIGWDLLISSTFFYFANILTCFFAHYYSCLFQRSIFPSIYLSSTMAII